MKKTYSLLMIMLLVLTGCSTPIDPIDEETELMEPTIDEIDESDDDLTGLPYYSYLKDDNPTITITVENYGDMELQLFPDVAKNTVDNFINYIQTEAYDDSTFHRIIKYFMIQGGIVSQPNCSIEGEFSSNGITNNLSHQRGVISMARTSIKDSATSQFFIVHQDSVFLDGSYAAFGGLISGFELLDILASVSTGASDNPLETVSITTISIQLNGYSVGSVSCAS